MATTVQVASIPQELPVEGLPASNIVQEEAHNSELEQQCEKIGEAISRPLTIYTRAQILFLHESPLVKPPSGMPPLREWFGCVSIPSQLESLCTHLVQGLRTSNYSPRETRNRQLLALLETGGWFFAFLSACIQPI
jgi:hypothetical protein